MNAFLEEVVTQGKVLREFVKYYQNENPTSKVASIFREKGYKRVLFAGMGSSYYAPYAVADHLTKNKIPSVILNAFEVSRYQLDLLTPDTMLVATSQSGKSKEVVELIGKAKDRTTVVGLVNKEDSPLAQQAEFPIFLKAGPEAQISNKSYLCTQAALNVLSADLTGELSGNLYKTLDTLADWLDNYLENLEANITPAIKFIDGVTQFDFIANGPSMSTAMEAGLTFREGPHVPTSAIACADYAHGWERSMKAGGIGVILAPGFTPESGEARVMKMILDWGGKVILLTDSPEVSGDENVFVMRHLLLPASVAPMAQIVLLNCLMGWMMGERSR